MVRSDLAATQPVVLGGLEPVHEAANVDGNAFPNSGNEFIHVINGGGGAINVTLPTPGLSPSGLAIADPVVNIPAGEDRMIGTFRTGEFNQTSGADRGKVYIDYDTVTTVTVAALRA